MTPSEFIKFDIKKLTHMRTPEIIQKSSNINVVQNEPGHVGRLAKASRVTRDDI